MSEYTPKGLHDLVRSETATLRADVSSTPDRGLTEEMLIEFLNDTWPRYCEAMRRKREENHKMLAEWIPIIMWLNDQKREEDAWKVCDTLAVVVEWGITSSSRVEFMTSIEKEYQNRER